MSVLDTWKFANGYKKNIYDNSKFFFSFLATKDV